MAPKRPRDEKAPLKEAKKSRSAFSVGPDNLPDGTWRRKIIKIKKDLIHKAKVKKSYAKLKAREPPVDRPIPEENDRAEISKQVQELHPERKAMLERSEDPAIPPRHSGQYNRKRPRKPAYFEKEVAFAEKQKVEAEARRTEFERRDKERRSKIEERERFRKAMAKARTGGRNGQRKLGRESEVLLEKVRRVVAQ